MLPKLALGHVSCILLLATAASFLQPAEANKWSSPYLNGVNLGGWLVLEPWMSRSSRATNSVPPDLVTDFAISQYWRNKGKLNNIRRHRDTFITGTILDALRWKGVNLLRVPLGHWATGNAEESPYLGGALKYVDWLMNQARRRRMKVLLDMHAAYGSQNGFAHSSPEVLGQAEFCTNTDHQDLTLERIKEWTLRYKDNPSFFGIAVLNEPTCSSETLNDFYTRTYTAIREIAPNAWVIIAPNVYASDGDVKQDDWKAQELRFWSDWGKDKSNVALDLHHLQTSWALGGGDWWRMSVSAHIRNINTVVRQRLRNYVKLGGTPLYIGEWSAAGPMYSWRQWWRASKEIELYRQTQQRVYQMKGILGNTGWSARVDGNPAWSFLPITWGWGKDSGKGY